MLETTLIKISMARYIQHVVEKKDITAMTLGKNEVCGVRLHGNGCLVGGNK